VLQRDHDGVDDGWLCDKGRFAYQAIHVDERITEPLLRDGGELRPIPWELALETAAAALGRARGRVGALAGGEVTNEEGWLLARLLRGALASTDLDSRPGGALPLELHRALLAPALGATVPDLQYAHAVLVLDAEPVDDAPILDLRIRKGVRHHGVRLFTATSRPSSLDPRAEQAARFAPGAGEAFLAALEAALGGTGDVEALAAAAGASAEDVRALAEGLGGAGTDVVILWGERLTHGPRGAHAARALLNLAGRLGLADHAGAGLLEIPSGANGRGLREAGVLPNAGPGLAELPAAGRDAPGIAAALAAGELGAVYLLRTDPLLDQPDGAAWEAALTRAPTVIAHAGLLTEGLRRHATLIFPAESYAEKEGTLTHPDGRLQRLRRAIGRQGETRAEWQVLAELSARLGKDLGLLTSSMVTGRLLDEVPFYAGLSLDAIGARGVRWPEREAAAAFPPAELGPFAAETPPAAPSPNGALRLGTFRSIWAAPEVGASPALRFLAPRQRVELSPADAERLQVRQGETVQVGANGHSVTGTVHVRAAAPEGSVFLETALDEDSASRLEGPLVEVRRP
jgi:NADH-quinone oxidoreductase subunit G